MIFNSFTFLWIFPIIFFVYYGLIYSLNNVWKRAGNTALLVISYVLYANWNPAYALLLFGVTAVTYIAAMALEQSHHKRKWIVSAGVLLTLLPLLIFKYYNFICLSLTGLLDAVGLRFRLPGLNWALPVGISFYTLQALGYLWDVWYGRIKAERNWWDYMLFVSFFPQITSGPISRAGDLLPQIKACRTFDYVKAVEGLKLLVWGMFLKIVLADRLGLYVDSVYDNYAYQSGLSCLMASFAYSFQIYGDFAGYSLMAIGTGRLLGFDLINNFSRPYLSASVTEFWHRWHISLSLWLKDYVYIPLGGSRCGRLKNYRNIFITFLVSGIWHGASWNFVIWGVLHGVFQIVEKIFNLQKCHSADGIRGLRVVITFLLVNFAWIFFRMPTLGDALNVIVKILTDYDGGLFVPEKDTCLYMAMALTVTMMKDIRDEYFSEKAYRVSRLPSVLRYTLYALIVCVILSVGVLDAGTFIYFQF